METTTSNWVLNINLHLLIKTTVTTHQLFKVENKYTSISYPGSNKYAGTKKATQRWLFIYIKHGLITMHIIRTLQGSGPGAAFCGKPPDTLAKFRERLLF